MCPMPSTAGGGTPRCSPTSSPTGRPPARSASRRSSARLTARLHRAFATPSSVIPLPVGWATAGHELAREASASTAMPASVAADVLAGVDRDRPVDVQHVHGDLHVGRLLRARDSIVVTGFGAGVPADGDPSAALRSPMVDLAMLAHSVRRVAVSGRGYPSQLLRRCGRLHRGGDRVADRGRTGGRPRWTTTCSGACSHFAKRPRDTVVPRWKAWLTGIAFPGHAGRHCVPRPRRPLLAAHSLALARSQPRCWRSLASESGCTSDRDCSHN